MIDQTTLNASNTHQPVVHTIYGWQSVSQTRASVRSVDQLLKYLLKSSSGRKELLRLQAVIQRKLGGTIGRYN